MASPQAPPREALSGATPQLSPQRPAPPALRRYPERGLLGGVCAGLAERLGVAPLLVRVLAAMVIAFGGVGVALYALAWARIPLAAGSEGMARSPWSRRRALVTILSAAGVLAGLRLAGVAFGVGRMRSVYEVAWPLVLGACGLALVWRLTFPAGAPAAGGRLKLREHLRGAAPVDVPRVTLGVLLFAFATASLLHSFGVLHSLGKAIWAVAIVATLLGLLFGPWVLRQGRSLASERAARIREQERAEVAAHLHDSVLQTLALIQKRAADPREVAGLARHQERELRRWLLEGQRRDTAEGLAVALERAAVEVEQLHGVPIEVVTVGDAALDGRLQALVAAAREAMTNAAKFSGCQRVDLYAQVDADRVQVFVRDRGVGFDPLAVPADRRGVRDSIIARLERHRGRAAVHSTPGEGTEVELMMERGQSR